MYLFYFWDNNYIISLTFFLFRLSDVLLFAHFLVDSFFVNCLYVYSFVIFKDQSAIRLENTYISIKSKIFSNSLLQ